MDHTTLALPNSTGLPGHSSEVEKFHPGNICYVLICAALVWLMIPGVGYFYAGMARSKSALSLIMLSTCSVAVVTIQWFLFGYSLTFSDSSGNFFIGDFKHIFLYGVWDNPSMGSEKIPDLVFCLYQCMFAGITPALAIGAAAERGRFLPTLVFIFIWTTLVYDPIAYWTWNKNGWSMQMGGLDFAGGTPIHISSGAAALAYAVILGQREKSDEVEFKPHSMSNVFLGTAFIWFGWFGFNGGSALAPSMNAVLACFVSNLAASVGGITWLLLDYRREKKFSALGFCCGAVAGLVCITPGCGYVGPSSSIAFGFLGALTCNLALNLKHILHYDDALDVFGVHGCGGIIGNILTGVFAQKQFGGEIEGGWLDGHWMQVPHQLADTAAGLTWSFCVTYAILYAMNKIPGLSLRVEIGVERAGLDQAELGFSCYEHVEDIKTGSQLHFGNFGTGEPEHDEVPAFKKNGVESLVLRDQSSRSERF